MSTLFIQSIKLLHQKAVVGVDRPHQGTVLLHIQKAIKNHGKNCPKFLIAVILSIITFFLNQSFFMRMFQYVYIVLYKSIKFAPSKAVVGVDWPIKALSLHIQKQLRITKGNNSHRIGP